MKKKEKFFSTETVGFSSTAINYSGYGYGRHLGGMVNIYGYDPAGNKFDYVVTFHRSKKIKSLLVSGEWWGVLECVRDNYSTNGYNTRVGIERANKKRCSEIAQSHACHPNKGRVAHGFRVFIRNNF